MGEGEQPASAPQDPSDIPTPKARRPRKKAQPKRNVCLDCGGPIQTLLLPGGGFADGCEICWKENNYKGEPPCNVQKSRYAEKAQKQLDKAQKRKDQKTPAEIQAERLLAARQEKLDEIRSKSPLKQALLSLIMHIEEQGLSEIELFHEIDQNGDGILTRGEMATALRRLGCPLSPAELDGVLRCFDADGSGSIDFSEFYQILKEENDSQEQKPAEEHDPRLCGFAIGDRVRLKCRLLSELSGASLLKDDLDVTTGKVMGPGKKQGIITIALEKNGDEMTVKASLLHKLTATKGHHHGCLCEACFLECYGTDYFGYAPDDQENPYMPQSPTSPASPRSMTSPRTESESSPRSAANSPKRKIR
ncbi:Putative calmodulin-like protein 6 [Durusdinium trenchii]|uniref:Calmodulin-like protein 6 n=1 Tax=Durusdinium trenchii TaxID=1381693 RepID=A0ABP0LAY9_9DINO